MKWWKIVLGIIVLALSVIMCLWYITYVDKAVREPIAIEDIVPSLPSSPFDASYNIDGKEIQLTAGRFEKEIGPGTAVKEVTEVWGEPIMGDVNGDGAEDAVFWLTYNGGGSGTFFYLAVAVWNGEGFVGSNAILLGDRIAPQHIKLWYDVIVVNYAERTEGQSLSEQPSLGVSRYFTVSGAEVAELGPLTKGEEVLAGTMVWGPESRTFTSCNGETYWIASESSAHAVLEVVYTQRTIEKNVDTPVFVLVGGAVVDAPAKGSGADYKHAFEITALLSAPESAFCETLSIVPVVGEEESEDEAMNKLTQ